MHIFLSVFVGLFDVIICAAAIAGLAFLTMRAFRGY